MGASRLYIPKKVEQEGERVEAKIGAPKPGERECLQTVPDPKIKRVKNLRGKEEGLK